LFASVSCCPLLNTLYAIDHVDLSTARHLQYTEAESFLEEDGVKILVCLKNGLRDNS